MNPDGELARLGRVDPPGPGVLDAAREVLWAAVAAEMLVVGEPGTRRAVPREAGPPGQARSEGT
jgi:hypothetical protein